MSKNPLSKKDLNAKFTGKITQQNYTKKQQILGLQIIDLSIVTSEDGYFLELTRLTEDGTLQNLPDFKLRQLSYSILNPGGVKGWHLHLNQTDIWFVPPESTITVGLYDLRRDSPTKDLSQKLILGNHKAQLLLIPPGVAHGVTNNNPYPVSMFYFVDQQFNLDNPDEYRLPWDFFGKDFWEIAKG